MWDLEKTPFARWVRGSRKPNDLAHDLVFVAGIIVSLVSQSWVFLIANAALGAGEVAVLDLEEYNVTYAAYRMHLADGPPTTFWIYLSALAIVGDAVEVAKFLAKVARKLPKGHTSAELIAKAQELLDPSDPKLANLRKALSEAAEAETAYRASRRRKEPMPSLIWVSIVGFPPIRLGQDGLYKLFHARIRRGRKRFDLMRKELALRAEFKNLTEDQWKSMEDLFETVKDEFNLSRGKKLPGSTAPKALKRSYRKTSRALPKRLLAKLDGRMASAYRNRRKELLKPISLRREQMAEAVRMQIGRTLAGQHRQRIIRYRAAHYGEEDLLKKQLKSSTARFRDWATVKILQTPGHPYELWINIQRADGALLHPHKYRDDIDWKSVGSAEAGHGLDRSRGGTDELERLGLQDTVWNRLESNKRTTKRLFVDVQGIAVEFDTAILHHAVGVLNHDDLFAALSKGFVEGWNPQI